MRALTKEKQILKMIDAGENLHIDFKFEISNSKKIARTLSAFANTEGGTLLVGVKDNGKIAGIRSEEELYMIQAASYIYTKPIVEYQSWEHRINGKNILEVKINKSERKPHLAPDEKGIMKAYVRVEDQNFKANGILIKVWKREKLNQGVKISYSSAEKYLLNHLSKNNAITLSKFRKITGIKSRYAEKILIDFILLDIIKIVITDKQITYRLNDKLT